MRNGVKAVWPGWGPGRTAPWANSDNRKRTLSMIKLVLPTSADRDAAWLEKYGEQLEQAKDNRVALRSHQSLDGGQRHKSIGGGSRWCDDRR